MSDYQKSSRDLINKINRLVESDGTTFLSSKVECFINDEYTKERERLVYDANMKVEELNFHNQTTVFNLEKLWDILHKQYVIKKGRPVKVSPIDSNVLNALEHSVNDIIMGEKQRCPGIFAFGEPAPTPDFMIGGYKIPDNITFKGVRRGRKPDSLKYYSFISTYYASKLDPMGPIESNIDVDDDVSNHSVQVTNSSNVVNTVSSDQKVQVTGSVNVVDKAVSGDQKVQVAGSVKFLNVADVIVQHPSVIEIKKYAGGQILDNSKCCRLGYHIDVLKQDEQKEQRINKTIIAKSASKSKNIPTARIVPQVYYPVVHPPNPKHNPNYGVRKYFMDPKSITYKPIVKPQPQCDPFLNVPPQILRSFPPSIPAPKIGRPMGSANKTAEEKEEIEKNKNPQGRPKGSVNTCSTHQSDLDAIIWDNEILLRINPNLFEVHMIKYTIDNADISYAQWTDHADSIVKELYDENKRLTKMYIENWEEVTLNELKAIWRKYLEGRKREMSDRERRREELRERMLNVNSMYVFKAKESDEKVEKAEEVNRDGDVQDLKNGKYIDVESDNIKSAVNDMHSLLRSFKNNDYIDGILRNALKQLNSLDESKLESDEVLEVSEGSVESSELENNISNIMDCVGECDTIGGSNSSYDILVSDTSENSSIMDEEIDLIDLNDDSVIVSNDKHINSDSSSETSESIDVSLIQHLEMSSNSSFSWGCDIDNNNDIILNIIDVYISDSDDHEVVDFVNILGDGINTHVYENIINLMEKPDSGDVGIDLNVGVDAEDDYIFDVLVNHVLDVSDLHNDVYNDVYNNMDNNNVDQANIVEINTNVNSVNITNLMDNFNLNVYQELFVIHDEMFERCENRKWCKFERIKNNRNNYFYGSMNKKRSRKQRKIKSGMPLW